jgi:LmbE family N-acetylglucosaminyl deacetylase
VKHLFPPLLPKEMLEPPVLAIAAHPDDEVIGCGAMLAWHAGAGHAVTVVHLTDGAGGDPSGRYEDIRAVRRAEGREAAQRLGVRDVRQLDFPDGELPERLTAVTDAVRALFAELRPRTVYAFWFTEAHRDHRAAAVAVAAAAPALDPAARLCLFGVNHAVAGGSMFDVTAQADAKRRALAAFKSQLAYNDFATKVLHRDQAAPINIEDPAVRFVEAFAVVSPSRVAELRARAESLQALLLDGGP